MAALPTLYVYSYWLIAWTALSFMGLVFPPTLSLLFAVCFNTTAALILPHFGIEIGIGTAAYSARAACILVEFALFGAAYLMRPGSLLAANSVAWQLAVVTLYFAFAYASGVDPWRVYMVDMPASLQNKDLWEVVEMRMKAPLFI